MTLWLTLLLVWTAGIPIALFAVATLTARMHERRLTRRPTISDTWSRRLQLRFERQRHPRQHQVRLSGRR